MSQENLVSEFLSYLENKRKTSQNTLSAYSRDLSCFSEYVNLKKLNICEVSNSDIASFKKMLVNNGKSVATVSRYMSSVRSFYKYLSVTGVVEQNPALDVKNDKTEKKFFEILTEEEIDKLLSQPDTSDFKGKRDKAMLEILYATGMKVSELISLDVSDVNLKMNYIRCHTEKNDKKSRVVLLYQTAVNELADYINNARNYFIQSAEQTALFVNVNGERLTRQGFWKLLKNYVSVAKIDKTITPHTLRHSFATHLLQNGADINDIKDILGHQDISSTLVYSNFIKSKLDKSYLKFNHRSK